MTLLRHIEKLFYDACMAEIEALKPGNVHMFSDGHGMVVQDFVRSAEVTAPQITRSGLSLGERIYASVEATIAAVGCNTNLGIILLCAPILQLLQENKDVSSENILSMLSQTTSEDTRKMYDAIRLASPGGLGNSAEHDVYGPAPGSLIEAMKPALHRDMIAFQYVHGYQHLFQEGLGVFKNARSRMERPAWAVSALYLHWLASYPDSHVVRKHGNEVATQLLEWARYHRDQFSKCNNPKVYMPALLRFDQELKEMRINPGTSADLTVATIFLYFVLSNA